jgi:ParB-like chromosome segregation protein Spo0J
MPTLPVAEIVPFHGNARVHPQEQIDRLADSLRRFGFVAPVLLDAAGVIIAGHGRLRAAQMLWSCGVSIPRCPDGVVPVIYAADLTPSQVRAFRIADNKLGALSHFDDAALSATLRELTAGGFSASALGFSDDELRLLTAEPPADPEPGHPDHPDSPPIAGAEVDPYSLLTFTCLATSVQRDAINGALERAQARTNAQSPGHALVELCRRYTLAAAA